MDRDFLILREVDRWRFCLGRHLRFLGDFSGQRTTDKSLRRLLDAGYLQRKRYIYGVPGLYTVSYSGRLLIGASTKKENIKIEQIPHDIAVLDTVIYFLRKYNVELSHMISEKELHKMDGFRNRKHRPDFMIEKKEKKICIEVELSGKSKNRLESNIKDNYLNFDSQIWVVPITKVSIRETIEQINISYQNISIIPYEEVLNYVRELEQFKRTE